MLNFPTMRKKKKNVLKHTFFSGHVTNKGSKSKRWKSAKHCFYTLSKVSLFSCSSPKTQGQAHTHKHIKRKMVREIVRQSYIYRVRETQEKERDNRKILCFHMILLQQQTPFFFKNIYQKIAGNTNSIFTNILVSHQSQVKFKWITDESKKGTT